MNIYCVEFVNDQGWVWGKLNIEAETQESAIAIADEYYNPWRKKINYRATKLQPSTDPA